MSTIGKSFLLLLFSIFLFSCNEKKLDGVYQFDLKNYIEKEEADFCKKYNFKSTDLLEYKNWDKKGYYSIDMDVYYLNILLSKKLLFELLETNSLVVKDGAIVFYRNYFGIDEEDVYFFSKNGEILNLYIDKSMTKYKKSINFDLKEDCLKIVMDNVILYYKRVDFENNTLSSSMAVGEVKK